jgi:alpha-L-arabinofuranosidase
MRPLCLLAVSTSLMVTAAPAASAGAVIEINAAPPGSHRILRSIFGTFLEPIGRSIYGGLWAQLLDNPSFEDNLWSAGEIRGMIQREAALERSSGLGLPLPWEPLDYKQGVRFEPRWGDAANSYRSLLVMGLGGKQCGVRQQVYLPVHRILRYQGSLYAKRVSGPGALEVSLRKRNQP